jgi:DNA-binding transcriptional LysR family regulator
LAEVSAAEATMRARKGLLAGRVSIGTPPSVGVRLLPKTLSAFHQTYPDIELRIHQAGTNQLLQLLEFGEIDIAIATLPVPSKNHVIIRMFDEPLVAVVSTEHRYAARQRVTLAELAHEGFLLYPTGYEMHDVIVSACKAAGFVPRVVVDGGDVALLLRLAEANLGIALVPRLAVTGEEHVAVLEITQPTLQRTMAIIYRSDRTISAASQVMIQTLIR